MASNITPNASSAPAPSLLRTVFFGPGRLRAGWRALIFLAIVLGLNFVLNHIQPLTHFIRSLGVKDQMTPAASLAMEIISVLLVTVSAWVMTFIEKKSFADYGLPINQAFGKRFWQGLPIGFMMLGALLLVIRALHGFSLDGLAVEGRAALNYGLLWALAFLGTGVFEEFSFRGYLQATLADGIGFWPAAILLSALFGAAHLRNSGEALVGAASAGCFGLLQSFALKRTGNLWLPISLHMSWDWGETYFYGVPDSGQTATGHLFNASFHGAKWLTGGSIGPEGSLLVFPVILLGALAIHFLFPTKRAVAG